MITPPEEPQGEGLKPCPFCGSADIFDRGFRRYECADCRAEGPPTKSKHEGIAAWNRRASLSGEKVGMREALEGLADQSLSFVELLNALRADEGSSVTLLCDNPEGPPNNAIEACGDWTNWLDRRFDGETLMAALRAAYDAMKAAALGLPPPVVGGEVPLQPPGVPQSPWPIGVAANSKREGWRSFFSGRDRDACPFPLNRRDLQDGFREGWDAAALHTGAGKP